jgi:hypothetical protein
MNKKLTDYIDNIYETFVSGNISELLPILNIDKSFINSKTLHKYESPFPSDKWSLFNQMCLGFDLVCQIKFNNAKIESTIDTKAAGFKQWNELGRKIKAGAKAGGYIFVPAFKYIEDKEATQEQRDENIKDNKQKVLAGFIIKPVFFYYQTEPIPGKEITFEIPKFEIPFNFKNLIKKLKIKIKADFSTSGEYGSMSLITPEITMSSNEKSVFYHELAHAVHKQISKNLIGGQNPEQEIIAELTSMILSYKLDNTVYKENLNYISNYAQKLKDKKTILKILDTTDKILDFIISNITNITPTAKNKLKI